MSKANTKLRGSSTDVRIIISNCVGPVKDGHDCLSMLIELVVKNGMTVRESLMDAYKGGGFECFLTLEESFVLVETWPECSMVKAWINLCNVEKDNEESALAIARGIKEMFYSEDSIVEHEDIFKFRGIT